LGHLTCKNIVSEMT